MTAKKYLRRVRELDRDCSATLERIEEMHATITKTTTVISDMPRGGGEQRKNETLMAEMLDLKREFRDQMAEHIRLKSEATRLINSLTDSRYRLVLSHYYLGGKTWEQTAVAMDISYQWAHNLHGQALKEFQKIMCESLC